MPQLELLFGEELHRKVILEGVLRAERFVWIATANLKDMHMKRGRTFRPVLEVLDEMAGEGVTFRIIHGDLPSRYFVETLERFPRLAGEALELQICLRSHWKMVIVDGVRAYIGSANFTGAGLGARSTRRRNLEIGIWSSDPLLVSPIRDLFDEFWMGLHCWDCALRKKCPDPIR
jgi:phosphatidylserine/phosphatidylglycerophosphate/cardiolipin synthase-like enzyme